MYDGTLNGHFVIEHLDPGEAHAFLSPEAAEICVLNVSSFLVEI